MHGTPYDNSLTEGLLDRRPLWSRRRRRKNVSRVVAILAVIGVVMWWMGRRGVHDVQEEVDERVSGLRTLGVPHLQLPGTRVDADDPDGVYMPMVVPTHVRGAIEPGQSLSVALARRGVPGDSITPVVTSMSEIFDFRRSQPGHQFEADLDPDGVIVRLRYQTAPEVIYEARWVGERSYESRQVEIELETRVTGLSGTVSSSLIRSVIDAGETEALARKLVDIFQWDIDFSRHVRPGDAFRLIYERVYLDGRFLRYGAVLAAEYRGGRVRESAYYFDAEGHEGYYTMNGEPLKRMFLVAPCNYRRISSLFDRNRIHPVLGVRRPHLGVDYAAPPGTPVWSMADGTVVTAGMRGGYGNLVVIRHDHGYETAYAHLSRFAAGLRTGQQVQQGQVIGYVGSTGLSTGPHLHYELRLRGEHIDPMSLRDTRGPRLTGRTLSDFQRRQSQLQAQLNELVIADVEEDTSPEIFDEDEEDLHDPNFVQD